MTEKPSACCVPLCRLGDGENRIKIIDLIKEHPHNINQLAEALGVDYGTQRSIILGSLRKTT